MQTTPPIPRCWLKKAAKGKSTLYKQELLLTFTQCQRLDASGCLKSNASNTLLMLPSQSHPFNKKKHTQIFIRGMC